MNALTALKDQPFSDETRVRIRTALADKNNLLVSIAAKLAKHFDLKELIPELRGVYEKFLRNPQKTDKLCLAKLAAVEALDALGSSDEELFLQAAGYVQLEPAYGDSVDTAGKLRIAGCLALARIGSWSLFFILADRLLDREPDVRSAAAQILAGLNDERSELLLRMKVHAGDALPEILGVCFSSLMTLDPRRSLPFVAGYLEAREARVAEEAMVALGESRHPDAFAILSELFSRTLDGERIRVLITSIALLRSDEAVDFLLRIVRESELDLAGEAVDALRIYRDRAVIVSRLRTAVEERENRRLTERFRQAFEDA